MPLPAVRTNQMRKMVGSWAPGIPHVRARGKWLVLHRVLLLILVFALGPHTQASDVVVFSAGKLHHFYQFSTNAPTEDLLNPWEGGANVYITAPTNLYRAAFGPAGFP